MAQKEKEYPKKIQLKFTKQQKNCNYEQTTHKTIHLAKKKKVDEVMTQSHPANTT